MSSKSTPAIIHVGSLVWTGATNTQFHSDKNYLITNYSITITLINSLHTKYTGFCFTESIQ